MCCASFPLLVITTITMKVSYSFHHHHTGCRFCYVYNCLHLLCHQMPKNRKCLRTCVVLVHITVFFEFLSWLPLKLHVKSKKANRHLVFDTQHKTAKSDKYYRNNQQKEKESVYRIIKHNNMFYNRNFDRREGTVYATFFLVFL